MSVESYIHAMPKVDLHVQLEGALQIDFMLMIAEQTDIAGTYKKTKQFQEWVQLLKAPDFNRIDEIARETSAWVRHPEDIARAVYDFAVRCSKENIHYAEISVLPSLYTDLGLGFIEFLDALNDGADRAERAWQVRLNWILAIPRENPRKSDDIARWATSTQAQKGHVVAMSLVGREHAQPIAQFKKAFQTVEKKELARITHVYSYPDADSFNGVMEIVNPTRITDAWGLIDDDEALAYVVDQQIPVMLTPTREVRLGRIRSVAEYPLRELVNRGVNVVLGSGMPVLFDTSLSAEYTAAVEQAGLTLDEIEAIALNSVRAALLSAEDRRTLFTEFQDAYAALRAEHLVEEAK